MKGNYYQKVLVFGAVLLLPYSIVSADAGIPLIFVTIPLMLIALVPVIIIEGIVLKKMLGVTYNAAMSGSFGANLVSFIFGLPLSWIITSFVGPIVSALAGPTPNFSSVGGVILLLFSTLGGFASGGDRYIMYWFAPIAIIVSLIPAFLVSVGLEFVSLKSYFKTIDPRTVRSATVMANAISYLLLVLAGLVFLFFNVLYFTVN